MRQETNQRAHADHDETHRNRGLRLDVKDVKENRHSEDRSAAAEESEDESNDERESDPEDGHRRSCSTRAMTSATTAGVRSRMQRQCPSGHCCGPCLSQGRHSRPITPLVAECGASGPNPNSGTVGPNTVTVGIPIADARCCGAESFVTSIAQRESSSAEPNNDNLPVALITRPGAAAVISAASAASSFAPMTTNRALCGS